MKRSFSIILLGLLLITSCKKLDEKTQFTYSIEQNVEIPSNIGINVPFNLPTPDVSTNIDHELEIRNKKKKRIEHIRVTSLALSIQSPSYANFDFLKDISIYISAEGLPEILIAQEKNLPDIHATTLNIAVFSDKDIEAYIKKDKINIHLNIVTDQTIFQNITVTVKPTFWVDVKVLGI